jgi:hypothetical protein
MPGLYSPFKVYTPGEVLTAADLNATDQTHITNQVPQMTDDYSQDLTQKRQQSDPASALATSLAIELQQIRYVLAKLGGKSFWDEVQGPAGGTAGGGGGPMRTYQLRGIATGTLSTVQLDANTVVFSAGTVKNSVSVTLNIATAGPIANGRDQAANFTEGWVNVFYIYNPTTDTVALIGNQSAAMGAPTMPAGYTEHCYATTFRVGPTPNQWLMSGHAAQACGSHVYYHPMIALVTGVGHTASQAIPIGGLIPWDRTYGCNYRIWVDPRPGGAPGSPSAVIGLVAVRAHENVNTLVYNIEHGDGFHQAQKDGGCELTLPIWSGNLWIGIGATAGTITCNLYALSYQVPNKDM